MINIPSLVLLCILQLFVISAGIAIVLYLKNRKLRKEVSSSRADTESEKRDAEGAEQGIRSHFEWKDRFDDLSVQFQQVKKKNEELKDSLDALIPEAERSQEYKQIIKDIEQNNEELNKTISALQHENTRLREDASSSSKIDASVSSDEYANLNAHKKSLELKVETLQRELDSRTKERDKLQQNCTWLEKEYNALYENIHEESS